MINFFNSLNDQHKGFIILAVGIMVLLNNIGIMQYILSSLMTIIAFLMIFYGLVSSGIASKIMSMWRSNNNGPKIS